jgi:hypothetical protein
MKGLSHLSRLRAGLKAGTVAIAVVMSVSSAWAADAPAATQPSQNVTINLIRLLVKQGVLSQTQADALVKEAEAEAVQARQAPPPTQAAGNDLPPPEAGSIRVPYVPENVKKQIADSIRTQVMEEARQENWAQPDQVPAWSKKVKLTGDLRVRNQSEFYSTNNVDEFVDFATWNDTGPYDVNPVNNPTGFPLLNTRTDRPYRTNFRARLNLAFDVSDGVLADIRLASGSNNGPVSTTQILGGGWGKKDVWLDQAYIRLSPESWADLTFGRMPNPFMHTEMVFDDDLNLDGAAASFSVLRPGKTGFGVSLTAGVFPLEYAASSFPTFAFGKAHDVNKWMQGGQILADWKGEDWDWKASLGYYDFVHSQGRLSTPCTLYNGNTQCDSDPSRPAFMQKGNTLFLLRSIVPDPANPINYAQKQFVGLTYDYNELDLNSQLSFDVGAAYQLQFDVDYVRNLAYDVGDVCRYAPQGLPVNYITPGILHTTDSLGNPITVDNFDPCTAVTAPSTKGEYKSGPNGVTGRILLGYAKPSERWEWNVYAGYRYLEPDAVLDAFTDSDFHLGGTNAKGWFIGGALGLFHNTSLSARWMSASEVYGPPLSIDVLQIDLNTGF